jgi:hypothetical protein
VGPIGCPETSAINYRNSLRNNPEERSSHLLRGGSLKSRGIFVDYERLVFECVKIGVAGGFLIVRHFLRKCKVKKLTVAQSVNVVVKVFLSSVNRTV